MWEEIECTIWFHRPVNLFMGAAVPTHLLTLAMWSVRTYARLTGMVVAFPREKETSEWWFVLLTVTHTAIDTAE